MGDEPALHALAGEVVRAQYALDGLNKSAVPGITTECSQNLEMIGVSAVDYSTAKAGLNLWAKNKLNRCLGNLGSATFRYWLTRNAGDVYVGKNQSYLNKEDELARDPLVQDIFPGLAYALEAGSAMPLTTKTPNTRVYTAAVAGNIQWQAGALIIDDAAANIGGGAEYAIPNILTTNHFVRIYENKAYGYGRKRLTLGNALRDFGYRAGYGRIEQTRSTCNEAVNMPLTMTATAAPVPQLSIAFCGFVEFTPKHYARDTLMPQGMMYMRDAFGGDTYYFNLINSLGVGNGRNMRRWYQRWSMANSSNTTNNPAALAPILAANIALPNGGNPYDWVRYMRLAGYAGVFTESSRGVAYYRSIMDVVRRINYISAVTE